MSATEIRELVSREPFEPFRLRLSSGDVYAVKDPRAIAIMKSRLFLALSGDDWVFIPLHIAAIENGGNGRAKRRR